MTLAITRCALLTPLDAPPRSTWEALRAGQRVGQSVSVHDALLDPDPSLDRSIRLGLAVARRVLPEQRPLALFCGTSKGPALTMLQMLDALNHGQMPTEAQARHVALGIGAMGAILMERLSLSGGHTSVAACSSGLHALHRAANALARDECERALVVAADASLHPLFEASFARLGVLAPADARGIRRCAPFSEEGLGFFQTEAAAAILLEKIPSSAPPLAWLDLTWVGGDGTGLIAIDERAAALTHGLKFCSAERPRPAFIHAHATGTAHDAFELRALRAAFGEHTPVFSHKAWLGHSLGAAGLVGVALSALSHHHAALPSGEAIPARASSLTIAQGFGGHIGLVRLRGHS
jgi:3-oxoacyl-(acyl-carrier-protein) synthase